MAYDKALLQEKLARWERFTADYALPAWESIPDFGLYMDQVVMLLGQYLDFIPAPAEGKDSFVTASTINNYVRLKLMPPPVKKKYGRVHAVYLIMILTLKLSLSISEIQRLLPTGLDEAQAQALYADFCEKFAHTQDQFACKLQQAAQAAQQPELSADAAAGRLIFGCALDAAFNALLAGKLIALDCADGKMKKTEDI